MFCWQQINYRYHSLQAHLGNKSHAFQSIALVAMSLLFTVCVMPSSIPTWARQKPLFHLPLLLTVRVLCCHEQDCTVWWTLKFHHGSIFSPYFHCPLFCRCHVNSILDMPQTGITPSGFATMRHLSLLSMTKTATQWILAAHLVPHCLHHPPHTTITNQNAVLN